MVTNRDRYRTSPLGFGTFLAETGRLTLLQPGKYKKESGILDWQNGARFALVTGLALTFFGIMTQHADIANGAFVTGVGSYIFGNAVESLTRITIFDNRIKEVNNVDSVLSAQ